MNYLESLKQRFSYDAWAKRRILAMLRESPESHREGIHLFAHSLSSSRIWLRRLRGEDGTGEDLWPEWSLDRAEKEAARLESDFDEYLAGLGDGDLDSLKPFRESKGIPIEITAGQVLEHILVHAAYHRGQISAFIREGGGSPANTDFINYLREHNAAGV